MSPERKTVLILGGTTEAVRLADRLAAGWGDRFDIVTSLAGRTRAPVGVAGEVRVGGFGGVAPMTQYLEKRGVAAVLDATHPFAARISENARAACTAAGVARIALVRPPWERAPGDDWRMQSDLAAAAAALPGVGKRAFLTVGRTDLDAFTPCADIWFLVRMIEIPDTPLPLPAYQAISGRGPFDVDTEMRLMEEHKIDVLVCKASGGEATRAKLVAARRSGIPVLMVERPPAPGGPLADSLDTVVAWFAEQAT
ncbi:MAG: cobalt-precorrin-6A reductase [Alphaproteobacteria bacterium]